MIAVTELARRVSVAAVVLVSVVAAVLAAPAPAGPKEFLEAIYKSYLGKESKGIALVKPAEIRRYFAPALAAAMIKDQAEAAKRREVPTLESDPFIDAQDWEIADIAIVVTATGAKVDASVSFTNFKEKHEITYDLVQTPAGWRIANIKFGSGRESLRQLLKVK